MSGGQANTVRPKEVISDAGKEQS